jgi:hypothetical protein
VSDRFVTIHAGPLWEVQLLRGQLEEEGIPAFLPDENTKRVDPFITGGFALAVSLQVPASLEARAREVLSRLREQSADAGHEGEDADDGSDAS